MVKTVELMGLATMNIFVALTLSVTVLHKTDANAAHALTESNITAFVNEVATVSAGLNPDMDQHTMVEYMMDRMTEDGQYKTTLNYKIGGSGEQQRELEMNRLELISHALQGQKTMKKHETKTEINKISINPDGRSAAIVITNYERGTMPTDDGFGDTAMVPVLGMSYCEQKIVLSGKNQLQIDGAQCTTTMQFEEAF